MKFKPGDIITYEFYIGNLISSLQELYEKNGGFFIIESSEINSDGNEYYRYFGDEHIITTYGNEHCGWYLANGNEWKKNKFRPTKKFKLK